MRLTLAKSSHHAPRQKAAQLDLLWRAADLRDHGRRHERNNAKFQTSLVFCPYPPVISICCYENGGVVDDIAHAGRRTGRAVRSCARTMRRALVISLALNGPCSFSHSAMAAKPARRCNASRAAPVIQAEMLTPSRVAAARTFS